LAEQFGLSDQGRGEFKRIAGQKIRGESATQVQPALHQRKGPSQLGNIAEIANQRVRLSGQEQVQRRKPSGKDDGDRKEKLLEKARKRFRRSAEAWSDIRKQALDDLKFRAGDQWPDFIRNQRDQEKRPCLTFNQIPQFTRQVTNDQRQNRPGIQVNPVDDKADVETADIIQGLVRHIEYDSGADAAYDTAFMYAATSSFGFWRVTTEYAGPMTFEQDIKIKRIANPFTVYPDPDAVEPDHSDAEYYFVSEKMTKDRYKEKFGDEVPATGSAAWTSIGDASDWLDGDDVRIVEYFYKDRDTKKIVQLSDGSVLLKEVMEKAFEEGELAHMGISIVAERETEFVTVRWAKLSGWEVLDETEWLGEHIPVVPVLGDELNVDGKLQLEGVVRFAKDPQRQFNFMMSATTEAIALAPKAPFVIAEGQIEGYEKLWENANNMAVSALVYKPQTLNDTLAPPPQRMQAEPAIQATTVAMMQASDAMKAVTGIYNAALGEPSNEKSGVAIRNRAAQSQGSNYHFVDNLSRAIRHTGRILIDLIPKVYDTKRVVRIIGEDGEQKTVTVGPMSDQQRQQQQQQLQQQVSGIQRIYDISVGKYDVTISTGPSYQTKREAAADGMLELSTKYPKLMDVAGDLVVKELDFPGATTIAERIKRTMPPSLTQDDDDSGVPPAAAQMIAQLTDQNQQLTQHLNAAQDDLDQKKSEKAMDLESKERIAFAQIAVQERQQDIDLLKIQADLAKAEATANAQLSSEMASREYDLIDSELDRHHEAALSSMEHQQSLEAQDAAHQQGLESQQQAAEIQPEPTQV
jgi:hypothetical protein